jgi:predicted exporter
MVCATLVSRLQLKTDFAELLPSSDASVHALRRVQARLPGLESLIINIRAKDAVAGQRYADALAQKIRTLPPELVGLAVADIKTERAWFEARQGLYMSLADLQMLRDRLPAALQRAKNPLVVGLDDDASAPQAGDETLESLQKRLRHGSAQAVGLSLMDRFGDGYFTTADGKITSVVVMPPGGLFHEHAGERLHAQVLRLIKELDKKAYDVEEVGLSGDIESGLEERDALENDLVWATLLSVGLICVVVVSFFGRLRALPLLALPAFFGALCAYAFAQLAFGYLNSSTAFLASIIIGNGVNFSIIQLARYEEERQRGHTVPEALTLSLAMTLQATGLAALAASIAYASLTATQFRGFSQFGLIGGVGMMVAWASTLGLLPCAIWLLDRRAANASGMDVAERGLFFSGPLAKMAARVPRLLVTLAALATVACLVCLPQYLRDPFEYNFRNLRSSVSDDATHGEARWYGANGETFGRALNPLVVLCKDPTEVQPAKRALLAADATRGGPPMLDSVISLDDLVPGPVSDQRAKLGVLQDLRGILNDADLTHLPGRLRRQLTALRPPADLQPVTPQDVPLLLRRFFTEVNGALGNVLLVFPKTAGYNSWDGRDMMRLDARVGAIEVSPTQTERTVGAAMLFTGMIRSIVRDGPLCTLASACGVTLLVVLFLRKNRPGIVLVLGTLAAGFIWMLGLAAALGLRINFLNFVALPVTLGIGVDYGINIYMRALLEGPGRLQQAVRATGGAVALCSATTIIGYGALLVADNRGLRSFGTLAILGEIACLTAALLIMPAYLMLRENCKASLS